MPQMIINHEKVTKEAAEELIRLCPFSAISYENGRLDISSGCKMCRLCVKKGPAGVIEYKEDEKKQSVDKSTWKGIAVYADHDGGRLHNVTLELLGKAAELARVTKHPVYALLIGHSLESAAKTLLSYGADKVFVYDDEGLADFRVEPYTDAFEDFILKNKPSSVLVGATNLGRSLAPRVAARFRTGLTADCTVLEMKENTDLVQIRPAFGGNIMAQIITPDNRPQFCTVRYKVFSAPERCEAPKGEIISCAVDKRWLDCPTVIEETIKKARESDISESEVLIAVGRGFKSKDDIKMAERLAELLGGEVACTRPLVENGWFDAKHQIGLSGKTVKPKLIITLGISGAVQFAAGMKSSDTIIAVSLDSSAPIFDVAHYCVTADIYKLLPSLIKRIEEHSANV